MQRTSYQEQRAKPRQERVEDGTCIDGLTFVRVDEAGCAVFRHHGNDSRLREGDLVTLRQSEDGDETTASIYREEREQLWLVTERGFRDAMFEVVDEWFVDEAFLDLEGHYLTALERVATTAIGQECILPLLNGEDETELDEEEFNGAMEELSAAPRSWEEAQQDAIASCLAADRCYVVQGPPGTGKTRVLAEVVRRLVERGERVLITGFTHRAIDNVLAATARAIDDRSRVARICAPVHGRSENFDRYEHFSACPLAEQAGGWVAAATPFALNKRLPGVEFDTIVVDEAGQMTTALAIMAMLRGRKYLLFGDDQQLGPVVVSQPRRDAARAGIFHTLKSQARQGTMLDVTYRLNARLAEWPSENFYHGELTPAPTAADRRLAWSMTNALSGWLGEALDPASPLVWLWNVDERGRTVNQREADCIAELLRAMRQGGVRPEDVAVVTPYRRQARAMRHRLESMMPGDSWRGCLIDTVERMQGQEREAVILSLCASEPRFIQRQAEFLYDPRRLNVAATRARAKFIVVAAESILNVELNDTDLAEEQALLKSLARMAKSVSVDS